ncbi:MAG: lysylphosphatidylglycerol synthase transmembrane domain-containing protein, partial [Chloroflexota bacterium]
IYHSALHAADVPGRVRDLLPMTFASLFLNATTPLFGAAGAALFIDDANRQGRPVARTAAAMILVLLANYGAFTLILVPALVFLSWRQALTTLELTSAIILLLIVGGLLAVLALGVRWPILPQRLLEIVQQATNGLTRRLGRPPFLATDWAKVHAAEVKAAGVAMAAHPGRLLRTLVIALTAHLTSAASLFCLFLAFHQPVQLTILWSAYAMTTLFWIVSPTPSGVGIVEALLPLVYVALGVPAEAGTIINLSFRGLSFWLPVFVGFILLRRIAFRVAQPAGLGYDRAARTAARICSR